MSQYPQARPPLVLREYESASIRLSEEEAPAITRVVAGKLAIAPSTEADHYRVTAMQYVGTVVLPGLEILIRPKVPIGNLFLLLDIGLPSSAWRNEAFSYETDRNLLGALASFFARTTERTVGRGLLRSYRSDQSRLVAVRGRIDVREQLKRPGAATPIACVFDEYTADIDSNRYLKAAIRRLLRSASLQPETRRLLQHSLQQFEEVADEEPDPNAVDRMVFTRLNRHYEPALRLGRLVLRNLGLVDLRSQGRGTSASAFLLDMNELFQRWLTARLRRSLRGRLQVVDEPSRKLGTAGEVDMRPDLVFRAEDRDVYVADIKYKLTDTGRGRTPDYYQLLAYATALALPEGVLIYCQADTAPPRAITVRHAGKRLRTFPLDLRGTAEDIEAAALGLAEWILNNARSVSTTR